MSAASEKAYGLFEGAIGELEGTGEWFEVMRTAHGVGLRATATIMFGHVERDIHWARHLLRIRDLLHNRRFTIEGARKKLREEAASSEPRPATGGELAEIRDALVQIRDSLA